MTIYIDANFILQLAFEQEHLPTIAEIRVTARSRGSQLKCPVVALVEAVAQAAARNARRADFQGLISGAHKAVDDLRRSDRHLETVRQIREIGEYLQSLRAEEEHQLDLTVREFFGSGGKLMPFGPECIGMAASLRKEHALRLADSYIAATILVDLYDRKVAAAPPHSIFLTGDKGFEPLGSELRAQGCKLFTNFQSALEFLKHAPSEETK